MNTVLNEKEMTYEEAVELALEIERVEASLKIMKSTLKSYVECHGNVNTNDKTWGFVERVSWVFNEEGLEELARGLVLDATNPWAYLSFPSTSVNKIKKKLGWTDETFKMYGIQRITKSFTSKKIN